MRSLIPTRPLPVLDAARRSWLRQAGFTLVELSVSMTIAAILVVASLQVVRTQLDQAQVNASSFFLQHTVQSLQDYFVSNNGSAGIDNAALVNSGAVASQYVGSAGGGAVPISNTWGGRLFVGSLAASGNADWVMQASGLPMRLCSDIVQDIEANLNNAGLRHALAGAATSGGDITTPALGTVYLDANRQLRSTSPSVFVLKTDPFSLLDPAPLSSLCEINQPYFNLFLAGSNNAL